jgi:uncharacterized phage protein gp47/JayE
MSFERPDLATLIERIQNDAQSRLSVAQLRRSNANVFAKVLAGAVHTLYGYITYMHRQQFFDTAEAEYLDRWGSLYGLTRKKASKATGSVVFSFSDGQVSIPEGTVLQHEDGAQYVTTGGVDANSVVTIEALTAGTDGNQTAGDVLSLVSPISGVYSECTIKALSGGSEEESDSAFRSRLLERVQETPHAGTQSDYENWALEVPGVTRAWCNPLEDGNGSVAVRFVCDENESILPDKAMLDKVQAYIDELRPVTAQVYVKQITLQPVNISISKLTPDTTDVKTAVENELRDLFTREAEPGGRVYVSHIRAAISTAMGEEDHALVSPAEDPVPNGNALLTLGEITWL